MVVAAPRRQTTGGSRGWSTRRSRAWAVLGFRSPQCEPELVSGVQYRGMSSSRHALIKATPGGRGSRSVVRESELSDMYVFRPRSLDNARSPRARLLTELAPSPRVIQSLN